MTTTKEDQMRAAFEHHILNIAPINLSRCDDGDYCDMIIDARWMDWKACAESYESKLAEKDAEIKQWQRIIDEENKDHIEQLYEANARNARLVDALTKVQSFPAPCEPRGIDMPIFRQWENTVVIARDALSANSEAVAAYDREVASYEIANAASEFSDDEYREITYGAVYRKLIRMAEELKTNKVKNDRNNRSSKTQHNITS